MLGVTIPMKQVGSKYSVDPALGLLTSLFLNVSQVTFSISIMCGDDCDRSQMCLTNINNKQK